MPELDRVWIAYGEHGVTIDVPGEATTVVAPQALEAAPDPMAVLGRAMRRPIAGPRCVSWFALGSAARSRSHPGVHQRAHHQPRRK